MLELAKSLSIALKIIRIHHKCEGRIEKSVRRITGWHHEACRVMTNGDPEGRIIRIYHECEGRIEKSVPRNSVWHHDAFGVMTNGDPEEWIFYPTLTRIMDSFSCSPLFFYFKISFQKSLNTLRCNFT